MNLNLYAFVVSCGNVGCSIGLCCVWDTFLLNSGRRFCAIAKTFVSDYMSKVKPRQAFECLPLLVIPLASGNMLTGQTQITNWTLHAYACSCWPMIMLSVHDKLCAFAGFLPTMPSWSTRLGYSREERRSGTTYGRRHRTHGWHPSRR